MRQQGRVLSLRTWQRAQRIHIPINTCALYKLRNTSTLLASAHEGQTINICPKHAYTLNWRSHRLMLTHISNSADQSPAPHFSFKKKLQQSLYANANLISLPKAETGVSAITHSSSPGVSCHPSTSLAPFLSLSLAWLLGVDGTSVSLEALLSMCQKRMLIAIATQLGSLLPKTLPD